MMKPEIIRNEAEYDDALKRIEYLLDLPEASETDKEIELLAAQIEQYEEKRFPIEFPDPVDAICFVMDQQGLTTEDLVPVLRSRRKVSEVLNRKCQLSTEEIRNLHEQLGIPSEILLQEVSDA